MEKMLVLWTYLQNDNNILTEQVFSYFEQKEENSFEKQERS